MSQNKNNVLSSKRKKMNKSTDRAYGRNVFLGNGSSGSEIEDDSGSEIEDFDSDEGSHGDTQELSHALLKPSRTLDEMTMVTERRHTLLQDLNKPDEHIKLCVKFLGQLERARKKSTSQVHILSFIFLYITTNFF